ncbi:MAG: shikimate dehydrogenase [Candidatus Muproteobacteria bacterium RBG_16_64_10]|uniref:Shikimate dehydrogenase (NADP(+)) n=1 Tax=Candidatus Muproteobacteria bacterium RBG_16_64_10 TaxID=1817757 RepID=A0A1F6T0F9_9PROT|nr:MAG: shikimate dehydrogenase [Candidatus Muproteobacteria bacterium RBG_16_64_10]
MAKPIDTGQPDRYAVMGNPVAHSKSPAIHKLFAHQFGHNIEYTAIQVDAGGFAQAAEQFRASGGKGLNVTVPFKLDAFRLADHLSDRAALAEAVNTLKFEADGEVFGDNTDGAGLVHDIEINLGVILRDKNILILGAGGAVRGVLDPILRHRPAKIVIANRTVSKAKDLVRAFSAHGKVEAVSFDDLKGRHFDIVLNGTSASLQGELPPLPVTIYARGALAYDMMYGDRPTPFMEWSMLHGADRVADGLGMLVEQAAESYFVWRGVRPETRPVIAALRKGG